MRNKKYLLVILVAVEWILLVLSIGCIFAWNLNLFSEKASIILFWILGFGGFSYHVYSEELEKLGVENWVDYDFVSVHRFLMKVVFALSAVGMMVFFSVPR